MKEYFGSSGDAVTGSSCPGPGASILVVDDNPINLAVISNLLKQNEVRVNLAGSGNEALSLTRGNKYDIIILDHMMPGKDGIETLHEIRSGRDDLNRTTPVICLTANATACAKEKYLSEGFDDYLPKPVDPEVLEDMLCRFLPQEMIRKSTGTDTGEETSELPGSLLFLKDSDIIDAEAGIKYAGNAEAYISLLRLFCRSIDERSVELERLCDEGDLKNYIITVHALKSSARTIGAGSLGDKAQALENAGKNGDTDRVKRETPSFLESCRGLRDVLSRVFEDEMTETDMPQADPEQLKRAYEDMSEAAEEMDCDRLQEIFQRMEGYRIPGEDRELWKRLTEASDSYDYGKVSELLEEYGKGACDLP